VNSDFSYVIVKIIELMNKLNVKSHCYKSTGTGRQNFVIDTKEYLFKSSITFK